MTDVRITLAVAQVLREFLRDPGGSRHGYELIQLTGFPSGKLYPVLARLHKAGVLVREREDIDPREAGRPARYMYRLSPDAVESVRHDLTELSDQLKPSASERSLPRPEGLRPRLIGGVV